MRSSIVLAFFFLLSLAQFSCSLNPLNGFLDSINVRILSPVGARKARAPIQTMATVPTDVPTKAVDFDCLAFNVTGYGIEEKTNVAGSEIPLEAMRLGLETPMEDPALNATLTFNVQIPTLLGVDPQLQNRVVQIFGVYTSLTDKTSCRGKNLSDFLVNDDPRAAVYLIGSGNYPSEGSTCTSSELCVDDVIARDGAGAELIFKNLFDGNPIRPEYIYSSTPLGSAGFLNSDLYTGGGQSQNTNISVYEAKPSIDNSVARLDFYFRISEFIRERAGNSVNLSFGAVSAPEYSSSGVTCTSTPLGSYSTLRFKIWNGTDQVWEDPPRQGSSGTLDLASANLIDYEIRYFDLNDSTVKGELINGAEYLIVSVRSMNNSCSSVKTGLPSFDFLGF